MKGRWKRLCNRMGVYLSDPKKEYKRLTSLYSKPVRAYHNLDHVAFCLDEFERINHLADRANAVELAIWFHDAKYDPQSHRNEEESANEAAAFCDRAGVLPEVKKRACEVIMASKHASAPSDKDMQVFTDVDLAILGQPPKQFSAYEAAIQREYRDVSSMVFRTKRAEILERLLGRESIYSTRLFKERYESKARQNLHTSIIKLRKGV